MKIALITEDGVAISQHFGRAPFYLVITIENNKIAAQEMRPKLGHNQFNDQPHAEGHHEHRHGMDTGSHHKHASMLETISDCQVVICGGMGAGAYDSIRRLNIQPILTDIRDIDSAVQSFIAGTLSDHPEFLH